MTEETDTQKEKNGGALGDLEDNLMSEIEDTDNEERDEQDQDKS